MFEHSVNDTPIGKIVCVGRNYADHAKELNNAVPTEPIIFLKPASSVASFEQPLTLIEARGEHHYECELALLIGESLKHASPEKTYGAVKAVGLALDLTLRELQTKLKEKGHPWERAKAFEGACPLSQWIPIESLFKDQSNLDWDEISFSFSINNHIKQLGKPSEMLFNIPILLSVISHWFGLEPGDVVLTGTPKGVGVLKQGDLLSASLSVQDKDCLQVETSVVIE